MKKLLMASVLALGVTAACQQKASAWSEFKFSAGVNLGWVGGGNRFLWGLYRSAPYPGGQDLPPAFAGLAGQNGYAPYGGYPYYGGAQAPAGDSGVAGGQAPMPAAPATAGTPQSYNPYYNTGYQPVGYYYPGSYYPSQVPSYWYGR
jgi:hypothetical protein